MTAADLYHRQWREDLLQRERQPREVAKAEEKNGITKVLHYIR